MTVQQAYRDITFAGGGVHRAAWQVSPDGNSLAAPAGRLCVVMANGFGGTKDTALLDYAKGFAPAVSKALPSIDPQRITAWRISYAVAFNRPGSHAEIITCPVDHFDVYDGD
ncbi:hypothetical protein ACFWWS_39820 [Streptomyces sp. NPDC059083]|uniref:hypothetical protein n=1 Tax=Streptomyces sp. NPDC059083 TaxID=3346721 RepID=UPI0036817312